MNLIYKNFKYISFDIFDTLVVRNVMKPTDVFKVVEEKYNSIYKDKISDFSTNRIKAQKDASLKDEKLETLIEDFYKELENYYDKDVCKKLCKIEKEVEINLCVPNKKYIELYRELIENNKKIIITSDMYLDLDTINKILKKCGITKYEKLYLSSLYQKRKSNGSMYDFIIKDLNISSNDLIHIGDNVISDYLIPKFKRIKVQRVKNKKEVMFYNKRVKDYNYYMLEKFISNNIDLSKSYYERMGYETFGPILYGFSKWLQNNIKTDKIFFLSRDGYLISKAFNILEKKDSTYFYASRRALIIPTLFMEEDLKGMTDKLYIRDYIKVGNLFRKLGLEESDYKDIVIKHGYSVDDNIKYEDLFKDDFTKLFNDIKPVIHSNSKKELENLLLYMRQEGFSGDVSIVDIGWNGNMQRAFNNIVNYKKDKTNIEGFYVGVLPESKNIGKINMHGFLFDDKNNRDIYLCLKVINSIFESMFLAPHGSVKKYKNDNGKIKPVLLDYEFDEGIEKKSYEEIQEGALQFIRDFNNSDLKYLLDIDSRICFYNMQKFAYYPKLRDVEKFGDFKFLEDDIIYLAKPKKLSYYLCHPKKLFLDVYTSGWLIGFMKRLTLINIFYTNLYKIYINIYLKKRDNSNS